MSPEQRKIAFLENQVEILVECVEFLLLNSSKETHEADREVNEILEKLASSRYYNPETRDAR